MNHLILFENFEEKLYREVNLDEWKDKCARPLDELEQSEIDWINQYDGVKLPHLEFDYFGNMIGRWEKFGVWGPKSKNVYYAIPETRRGFSIYWSTEKNPQELEFNNRLFHCIKLEDEYFACQVPWRERRAYQSFRFFICDTMDGIKELLQDLGITIV
jgi:hypothetical protein